MSSVVILVLGSKGRQDGSYPYSFIYSPNAIKTKHNKITQLGMTTGRESALTYVDK